MSSYTGVIHKLKTWPEFFWPVFYGQKTFELRKADRPFRVGDVLKLSEFDPEADRYTGRSIIRIVTFVMTGTEHLAAGYCALGLRRRTLWERFTQVGVDP